MKKLFRVVILAMILAIVEGVTWTPQLMSQNYSRQYSTTANAMNNRAAMRAALRKARLRKARKAQKKKANAVKRNRRQTQSLQK